MIGFMKRLWQDKRGNALMLAGACLPLLVGAAGLASDTIQWTLWKRQLQRAADSAAIAAVYDLENKGTQATARTAVTHDLSLNQHTWMSLKSGYPVVTFLGDSGVQTNRVSTSLAVQQPLAFSSFFMSTAPTIIANATAASIESGDACVQALETNASKTGITNSGNTAIYMPDCIMYSNSPSTNSASAGGSSDVTALAIAAVGGVQQSNNWHVQSYRPYSPSLSDPFANVTPDPSQMKCTTDALGPNTDLNAMKAAGYNCFSSLSVGSNKSLTVPADFGPIYINGGSARIQGDFNCTGCTIVLTNKDGAAPIGTFDSNAQAEINITAPTTGTYKGIAIYQDRRASDCSGCNKINGGSTSIVTGAMYFPSQELWYNGGGSVSATCTMFVARRIVFTGNSGVSNKFKALSECAAAGLPGSSALKIVRLVS